MIDKNLRLDSIRNDQLEQVSKIHISAFGDSFLSQVGFGAVRKYYKWLMSPPNECHAIGVFRGEELLGFCYAGVFRNAEYFFIKENAYFLFKQVLKKPSLWFSKSLWKRLGTSLLAFANHFKPKSLEKSHELEIERKKRYGILSIAVDASSRQLGIGFMLESEAERIAQVKGHSRMVLSVHPNNQNAISFYKKLGWCELYIDPSRPWQGYMEKYFKQETQKSMFIDIDE